MRRKVGKDGEVESRRIVFSFVQFVFRLSQFFFFISFGSFTSYSCYYIISFHRITLYLHAFILLLLEVFNELHLLRSLSLF